MLDAVICVRRSTLARSITRGLRRKYQNNRPHPCIDLPFDFRICWSQFFTLPPSYIHNFMWLLRNAQQSSSMACSSVCKLSRNIHHQHERAITKWELRILLRAHWISKIKSYRTSADVCGRWCRHRSRKESNDLHTVCGSVRTFTHQFYCLTSC